MARAAGAFPFHSHLERAAKIRKIRRKPDEIDVIY
jgi:hypothetical protein